MSKITPGHCQMQSYNFATCMYLVALWLTRLVAEDILVLNRFCTVGGCLVGGKGKAVLRY